MKTSTLLRIIIAVVLVAAYFSAPLYLGGNSGATLVKWKPEEISELRIDNLYDENVVLQKNERGRWLIKDRNGAEADPSLMGALLHGLSGAAVRSSSDAMPPAAPTLTVLSGRSSAQINLGPRLIPLREQLVQMNGSTKVVAADLLAGLGYWQREDDNTVNHILHKTLVNVGVENIQSLKLSNPLAEYAFEQGGGSAQAVDAGGNAVTIRTWRESSGHAANMPEASQIYQWSKSLSMLTVERFATRAEVQQAFQKMPFEVTFETSRKHRYRYQVSGAVGANDNTYVLQMLEPAEGPMYAVSGTIFRQLMPNGANLFANMPVLRTRADMAIAVSYERDGRRCILRRNDNGSWALVRPEVPYKIYTPPAMAPGEKSVSMAVSYMNNLQEFRTLEIINHDKVAKARQAVQQQPAARLIMLMPDRSKVEVTISKELENSGLAAIAVDGELGVVAAQTALQIAPDIEFFFDPEDVKGKNIQW